METPELIDECVTIYFSSLRMYFQGPSIDLEKLCKEAEEAPSSLPRIHRATTVLGQLIEDVAD